MKCEVCKSILIQPWKVSRKTLQTWLQLQVLTHMVSHLKDIIRIRIIKIQLNICFVLVKVPAMICSTKNPRSMNVWTFVFLSFFIDFPFISLIHFYFLSISFSFLFMSYPRNNRKVNIILLSLMNLWFSWNFQIRKWDFSLSFQFSTILLDFSFPSFSKILALREIKEEVQVLVKNFNENFCSLENSDIFWNLSWSLHETRDYASYQFR